MERLTQELNGRYGIRTELDPVEVMLMKNKEDIRRKLNIINKIDVIEYDCDGCELIYVQVDDNENNRQILKNLGATEEDFNQMKEYEGSLRIEEFAIEKLGAEYYIHKLGFGIE